MPATGSAIIILLAAAWLLQFALSYFQMRRFYGRIAKLHKFGSVWIGMEGSAWKRRQYVALVVDKNNIIQKAEQLSGWTIFAGLKPVQGLDGRPISDLMDDTIDLPVKGKLLLAFQNAVKHIEENAAKKAARENEAQTITQDSNAILQQGNTPEN
jgi:glucitol operon activator protein